MDYHCRSDFANCVCHEEEIATTDLSPAATTVLVVAICGVRTASAKEWGFFRDGESEKVKTAIVREYLRISFIVTTQYLRKKLCFFSL